VEGTGTYGARLARHLAASGVSVIDVDRPNRQERRRNGKSDELDAVEAARAALSGRAVAARRAAPGPSKGTARVAVLIAGMCLLMTFPVDSVGAAGRAQEVPPAELSSGDTDLEVFMKVGVTAREIATVRRRILGSSRVSRFAFLDRQHAYREAKRVLAKSHPELAKGLRPRDVPLSFRLLVKNDGMALILAGRLARLPGVADVDLLAIHRRRKRCDAPLPDVGVTMDLAATPEQVAGVQSLLDEDAAVAKIEFETQSGATACLLCLTKGDPETDQIRRNGRLVPTGFAVTLEPGESGAALAARVRAAPGVYGVQDNTQPDLSNRNARLPVASA
jgi:cell division protein FtsX